MTIGDALETFNEIFRNDANVKRLYVGVVASALRDSGGKRFQNKKIREDLAVKILDYIFGR